MLTFDDIEKSNQITDRAHKNLAASQLKDSCQKLPRTPNFMNKMFQVKDITYDLRDSNILCQPNFNKITYGKKSFSYYGTHIWNSLPINIKQCTSLDNFKTMLKVWENPKCQCSPCMCNVLNYFLL